MGLRVGKVTGYAPDGRVIVHYPDTGNTSLPLFLIMNGGYSMPKIGSRVATYHLDNGGTHGFVLGNYNDPTNPAGNATVQGDEVTLKCSYGTITAEQIIKRLEAVEDALGLPHEA